MCLFSFCLHMAKCTCMCGGFVGFFKGVLSVFVGYCELQ